MHLLLPPTAVLVGLDLDHGRLGAAGDAGDRPGVGIGFLQLVSRAVHGQLPHLLEGGMGSDLGGQRRALAASGQTPQHPLHVVGFGDGKGSVSRDERPHPALEGAFQPGPEPEEIGMPLPGLVDAGEGPVMKLVADVQSELEVVVPPRLALRRWTHLEGTGRRSQVIEDVGTEGSPGQG
ncbi:MAG TPA: hypothetical protein VM142_07790 [Acidimicrobiales bacterium]|nr:hypothetical protein [Acidimicrobiales bacterium]